MWKFIVDVVHDFVSSLQPDVGRGFLHISNVFLSYLPWKCSQPGICSLLIWFYLCMSRVSESRERRWREWNVKKKNLFTFWHSYNTCINVINFNADLGSNFLLKVLVISLQKKPANHDLYAFRRTKTPKWSGEPNDLKVVLGEQKFFSDSLCMRSSLTMVMVEWPTIHMLKHIDTDLVKLFG